MGEIDMRSGCSKCDLSLLLYYYRYFVVGFITIIYSDFGFGVFDWQQRSLYYSFVCYLSPLIFTISEAVSVIFLIMGSVIENFSC